MRKATLAELDDIMLALMAMLDKSPAPQMQLAEPSAARDYVRDRIIRGFLIFEGDFAIMYDVAVPWYTNKPVLVEELILRVYRNENNSVETAIIALDRLAALYKCAAICAGDTQIGYMRPKYEANGYVPMGFQLLKGR